MIKTLRIASRSGCYSRKLHSCQKGIHRDSRVFKVSEEVRAAVNENRPVVSLESTIYTHGFPYPDNLHLATRLESLVRHNGGIPAHCAVLDGVARVGLRHDEMQRLVEDKTARKVSRRDLGPVLGSAFAGPKLSGGTTIAGTMILSHLAGIKVFATGGLGGVHRGFEQSMDVSADLTEFGRTPVAVVSAGCKGFLDIPRTLEYLETEGACVATFADGREGHVMFPAFWARASQVRSPLTVRDEREAAAIIHAQHILGLTSGMLFANPVPEASAIAPAEMNRIIEEALARADRAGITGAANTPFVLNAIKELSNGASVPANRALIEANVIRGTRLAIELSRLERGETQSEREALDGLIPPHAYSTTTDPSYSIPKGGRDDGGDKPDKLGKLDNSVPPQMIDTIQTSPKGSQPRGKTDVAVIGSIALDLTCDYTPLTRINDPTPKMETSNPASMHHSLGGVGYNIAKAVRLAGGSSELFSVIGADVAGETVQNALASEDGFAGQLLSLSQKTAQYVAINDTNKDLVLGMADMSIFDMPDRMTAHGHPTQWLGDKSFKWIVIDANWNAELIQAFLKQAGSTGTKTAFEPVSTAKSTRIVSGLARDQQIVHPTPLVSLATPNALELSAMYEAARQHSLFERQDWWQVIDALGISSAGARVELAMATSSDLVDRGLPQQSIQLLPFIPCILTKLSGDGVLMTELLAEDDYRLSSPEAARHILARSKTGERGIGGVYMRLFPPPKVLGGDDVVSTNGVGDTFLGVLMAALTKRDGVRVEDAIELAQRASALTLQSKESVSPEVAKLKLALELL